MTFAVALRIPEGTPAAHDHYARGTTLAEQRAGATTEMGVVLREIREVMHLPADDPRRTAVVQRKEALVAHLEHLNAQPLVEVSR